MRKSFILLLLCSFFAITCSNNTSEQKNKDQNSNEEKNQVSDSIDSEIVDTIQDNAEHEEKYTGVKYLEDFLIFQNHDEVAAYFGEENVLYEEQNTGPGVTSFVSVVYPDNQNQVGIYWNDFDNEINKISFVWQYEHYESDKLEPGGADFPYKSGLKKEMSLEKLVELNNTTIQFNDFAWSLGGQFSTGMIVKESLNPELQDYIIHLEYIPEVDYANPPADFTYLNTGKIVSSDDENFTISDICIKSIRYSPCKCSIWDNE